MDEENHTLPLRNTNALTLTIFTAGSPRATLLTSFFKVQVVLLTWMHESMCLFCCYSSSLKIKYLFLLWSFASGFLSSHTQWSKSHWGLLWIQLRSLRYSLITNLVLQLLASWISRAATCQAILKFIYCSFWFKVDAKHILCIPASCLPLLVLFSFIM